MEEKKRSRRPRIGERRDGFEGYSSERGYRKPYNGGQQKSSYKSEHRGNREGYSYGEDQPRTESRRYNSYSESTRHGEARFSKRNEGYRKPYNPTKERPVEGRFGA